MTAAAEGAGDCVGGATGLAELLGFGPLRSIFFVFVAVFFTVVVPSECTPILRSGGWNRHLHFNNGRDIPDRKGQRSIRLSRSYRAIYEVNEDGEVEFVSVEEVNKHKY